jgi:phage shock protein PspC (stress-responsive transcriptional regulator)
MISGVCAGVADYFSVDPTLVRLLFLVGIFVGYSAPIWIYIVLWVLLPTDAKAEAGIGTIKDNVKNIKDTGKRIFNDIKSGIKD